MAAIGSSPHTRGAPRRRRPRGGPGRIIPAYAGSTQPRYAPRGGGGGDHPRIRGEHWCPSRRRARGWGSSPHTRGAPHRSRWLCVPQGDHPRIRGEHASVAKRMSPVLGSSPHTRGARDRVLLRRLGERIIPAYAGSTYVNSTYPALAADHPRIRGEHFPEPSLDVGQAGSSPHTRGAPPQGREARLSNRIIPAYAGSTFQTFMADIAERDHPRIRGEHEGGQELTT